jgi:hypothetical protein
MKRVAVFFILTVTFNLTAILFADDTAIAGKYLVWAQKAVTEGRIKEASIALERAQDFADCSSDLSYLLAFTRFYGQQSKQSVLEAVRLALETDKWRDYSAEQGSLLEADVLIGLHNFSDALFILASLPSRADNALLQLKALRGLDDKETFDKEAARALDKYPRDPRIVRVIFEYFADKLPEVNEDIISIVLRRLPILIDSDPELAYLSAPFIAYTEDARLLVAAYRAVNKPSLNSIPVALNLGLIDEKTATEDLFDGGEKAVIDKNILLSTWKLLRTDESRDVFRRNLLSYSGVITEDGDKDGIIEVRTAYHNGRIVAYARDGDQNGVFETTISFEYGIPVKAAVGEVQLVWERYPSVLYAELQGSRYIPRPEDFFFAPLKIDDLVGCSILYPSFDPFIAVLDEQTLLSSALLVERVSDLGDR